MKRCFSCGKTKNLSDFYGHQGMADGHLNKCKKCVKAYQKRRRNSTESREGILAYDTERAKTPKRKQYALEAQRNRRAKYPEKDKARAAINDGIRNGSIVRQPCEVCGEKAQAHHDDYSKPFEVRWLCFKHHRELKHRQSVGIKAIQPWLIP
jgi:hypothetical protein